MYRFYWQSGVISQHFTSSLDLGELFYNLLRNIPTHNERSGTGIFLFYMRTDGSYREVLRFDVVNKKRPYINVQSLYDIHKEIPKFVRA